MLILPKNILPICTKREEKNGVRVAGVPLTAMEARQVLLYAGAMAATLVLLNLLFYEELEAGNFSTPEIEINGGDSAYFGGGADSPVLPEPDSPNTPIIPKPNSPDTRYNNSMDSIANRDTAAEASKALSSEVPVREKASAEDNRRRQRAIECERWSEFRSEIYKPKEMAPSILEREEPCNGECVAVCICGSLRTFFEPKISKSIVETLITASIRRAKLTSSWSSPRSTPPRVACT